MLLSNLTLSYAEPLAELHRRCFEKSWSVADFRSLLALPTTCVWMTEESFLVCSVVIDEAEVLTIGVVPEMRRRGMALRLLEELQKEAVKRNIKRIFLEVAADNWPAQELYRKAGFSKTGVRRGYYQTKQGAVDALCLIWQAK